MVWFLALQHIFTVIFMSSCFLMIKLFLIQFTIQNTQNVVNWGIPYGVS